MAEPWLAVAPLYALVVFPVILVAAGASDILTLKIPNGLCLALAGGFLGAVLLAGLPWGMVGLHLLIGAGAFLAGFGFFAAGLMGGGDGKLLAAAALWLGWPASLTFLVYSALAGGLLALLLVLLRRLPLPAALAARPWAVRLHTRKVGIPYGAAFAAGGLLVYPQSPLFQALSIA